MAIIMNTCTLFALLVASLLKTDSHLNLETTGSCSFDTCGCGWKGFRNHCYYFSKFITTWYDASVHCRRLGGYLTKINDKQENEWLKSVSRHVAKKHRLKGGFWMGAEDIVKEGKWQWLADNSVLSFTDWNKGQPDNDSEDCLHLYDTFNFRWNDIRCTYKIGFVCERPMFLKNACKCYA